jgi:hypothetical protein
MSVTKNAQAPPSKKWSDLFDKQTQGQSDVIVATIEIHHENTPHPGDAEAAKNTQNRSTDVHPDARKIAEHLYTTELDTITKTTTRSELETFYERHISTETRANLAQLGIGFREVLFAMAKGMKVVNVFRPEGVKEQQMGWHKPDMKYRTANKESKKRLHPQSDGWTGVGKAPTPEIKSVQMQPEEKTQMPDHDSIIVNVAAKYSPSINDDKLDDDAIIAGIKDIKIDMDNHLCAIESLVPLHDDHADKITIIECNPCSVAKRVVSFHKHAKAELVILLDQLQHELDEMKARKVWLCEQLKN